MKIQLGTKPVTRKDMEDLRAILIDLRAKLGSLINRIPLTVPQGQLTMMAIPDSPTTVSMASKPAKCDLSNGGPGCHEQFHNPVLPAFHKWARILLSLFVDKVRALHPPLLLSRELTVQVFCVAYQPFLKNAKSRIWPAARQG